jgi:hypothetical protein
MDVRAQPHRGVMAAASMDPYQYIWWEIYLGCILVSVLSQNQYKSSIFSTVGGFNRY